MASPFRTFRKNQKAWMVALTILTMFAFVFLGSTARMGSSGKREDPEVFTWDYGTVHQSDLQYRKQQRQLVRQFMLSAIMKANPEPMFEARVREGINQKFPISDEKIVEAMLLEKKAKQLGIVISDDMVRSTIREISQNRLSPDVLASIVSQLQSRNGEVSQNDLFDALRAELSVDYARIAFAQLLQREVRQGNQIIYVFHGDTPGDRWDYFCRLNRKVTAQILPVPVEKFVADIPEPSPQELQKFYDQWKNVEPNPDLPTPGFRQPFKANFQYLKADYEPLLAAASPKITEQEIKSYYDEHKDEFKKTKLPDLPPSSESEGTTGSDNGAEKQKPADEKKSGETKTDSSKTDSSKAGSSKAGDKKSSEKSSDAKSAGSKTAQKSGAAKSDAKSAGAAPQGGSAKTGDVKSGDAKKSDDKKDEKKSGDKPDDGKQSSMPPTNSHNSDSPSGNYSLNGELLALADQPTAPPAQKSAAPVAKPEAKAPDAKSTDSSANKAPATKTPDAKTPDTKVPDAKTPATTTPEAQAAAPVEYEPLAKVSDTIRNLLAQKKVDDQVDAAFSAVELQLDQYARSLDTYRAAISRGNKNAKKPDPPDLTALAKPYGLAAKETDLISQQQAVNHTDIGKSYSLSIADSAMAALTGQRYNTQPFYRTAFALDAGGQPTLPMYQPQRTNDNENNRYLWWKTGDEAAHTPPLDEIKPEVTLKWKGIQARKPALAKADEEAAEARKLKQTLKETFGNEVGNEVSTIGPFSWMTAPVGQPLGQPLPTEVSGVEQAGNDFMKAVFALAPGETGVAYNEPQTMYYVVQVESEEPPVDELRQDFMAKMGSQIAWIPYAAIGAEENADLASAWLKQVKNEYGFQLAPGETLSTDNRTVE